MTSIIQGVLPALIMPYTGAGAIHEDDLRRQIDFVLAAGCQGVVVGQVSECLRLTEEERLRVAAICVERTAGGGSAVISTGAESTEAAVDLSLRTESAGADALLVMHPTTYALDDHEMFDYYARVIDAVELPVMVHHVGSLTQRPLSIETQTRLFREFGAGRVLFKPEAPPAAVAVGLLRQMSGGAACVFAGDGGAMLIDSYQRGLVGVIPASETAEIVATLWRLLETGQRSESDRLGYPLSYLMWHMMQSIDWYAAIAKHLLYRRALIERVTVRHPAGVMIDAETLSEVKRTYDYLLDIAKGFDA